MQIVFQNHAAADSSFSVQWNGGETGRTPVISAGQSVALNMSSSSYSTPDGTSCWARAYVQGGPNHDSGENFTYSTSSNAVVVYTLTGGVDTPSFSMTGPSASRLGMITEAAQKTGLFHVNYTIATRDLGGPLFTASMVVNTVDKVISGAGRITQTVGSPSLDLRTTLNGSYTYMTVMPDKSHILVVASGQGPIGSITPLTGTNVELRMILSSDWSSGVANYSYRNERGAWVELTNLPVQLNR
ncbi:MAG: DUF1842 domain-containing protein [Byssovorax sp.]